MCVFHDKVSIDIFGDGHVHCAHLKVKFCCTWGIQFLLFCLICAWTFQWKKPSFLGQNEGSWFRLAVLQSCYITLSLICPLNSNTMRIPACLSIKADDRCYMYTGWTRVFPGFLALETENTSLGALSLTYGILI